MIEMSAEMHARKREWCMDHMVTVRSKLGFFTPMAFNSLGLETNISLRPHFLNYGPSNAKLKFIIGGVKISCQMFNMHA